MLICKLKIIMVFLSEWPWEKLWLKCERFKFMKYNGFHEVWRCSHIQLTWILLQTPRLFIFVQVAGKLATLFIRVTHSDPNFLYQHHRWKWHSQPYWDLVLLWISQMTSVKDSDLNEKKEEGNKKLFETYKSQHRKEINMKNRDAMFSSTNF